MNFLQPVNRMPGRALSLPALLIITCLLFLFSLPAAAQDAPPPPPIGADLWVNGEIDGISAVLDWRVYEQQSQADIASYRVYAETGRCLVTKNDFTLLSEENQPPFAPTGPIPADGQTGVSIMEQGSVFPVNFFWSVTDPNPSDTVVCDLSLGQNPEDMTTITTNVRWGRYEVLGLEEGTTYYWRITARDNHGAETSGPTWSFTTEKGTPDLFVYSIDPDSYRINPGDQVTLRANIRNQGNGPAVDPFDVLFKIDDSEIATATVNQRVVRPVSVEVDWTASYGAHTVEVTADSGNRIIESSEENNSLAVPLPPVADYSAPALVGTFPADGARLKEASHITIVLEDNYGEVDDAAVMESLSVEHPNNGDSAVPGSISESSDTFTFTPDNPPLPDGTYTVSFTSADTAGNTAAHNFEFTIDQLEPGAPSITGGTVYSGTIQVRPAQNISNSRSVTLEGTRETGTGVFVDGSEIAAEPGGTWSSDCQLNEGENALEIWLEDEAGNSGPSVWVDILVDTLPPSVTSISPAADAFLNTPPAQVEIAIDEPGTGINMDNCVHTIENSDAEDVNGSWELTEDDRLVFTPAGTFTESTYMIALQLEDETGNRSGLLEFSFTVDTTAPAAPEINPVTSPTNNPSQQISGSKESHAAVWFNGEEIIGHTESTNWRHTVSLADGLNLFTITALDRAGNQSGTAEVEIIFDDVSPPPVDTLEADGDGDGSTVALDWTGYDESLHGDIDHYRIFQSESEFHDISEAGEPPAPVELDTVEAGNFSCQATGLENGAQYWFAVVAVDHTGLFDPSVTSVPATVADVEAAEDISELEVESFEDRLVFSWTHSGTPGDDFSSYRLYFNGDTQGETLSAGQNTWEATGLSPATAYGFKITVVDAEGNESDGVSITAATLMDNPGGLTAEAFDGHVRLNWEPASPEDLLKHYAVYVSETDFSSVSGLTPTLTTQNDSARVTGLENSTPYFFAVTAVNLSDGTKAEVETVSAIPAADESGPEISGTTFNENAFTDGGVITQSGTIRVSAADSAGISRVEFYVDDILRCRDYNSPYQCYLDIHALADGSHSLTIVAYDSLENVRSLQYGFTTELLPPEPPVIDSPASGHHVNTREIEISGSAEKHATVVFHINGAPTGNPAEVNESGRFTGRINLSEGENTIRARAENRAGTSDFSNAVTVTCNTDIPDKPRHLNASAEAGGRVRLSWSAVKSGEIAGYHIYRHSVPFESAAQASRLTQAPVESTVYADLPDMDGIYYYRATAVNEPGTESELSGEASAASDSQPPYAVSLSYTPQGAHDPVTGAMAPGRVEIALRVSEPLMAAPFLSITPEGGAPIPVELSRESDTRYAGFFDISETTPSGTAWAVFSGRDQAGNRGTRISDGRSVLIDAHGPEVTRLIVVPSQPIRNNDQTRLTAVFGLDEAIAEGESPVIEYILSAAGREPVTVDSVTETAVQADDTQTWQAEFLLPADAGLDAPETLSFVYEGRDYLGNTGTTISAENAFQVYQGELPPLATPLDLAGTSLPGGRVLLTWEPVGGAAGYQIYRMGPGDAEPSAHGEPLAEGADEFLDSPDADGSYTYTIASIRRENQQLAHSAQSSPVVVRSDSQAPPAPQNLALDLASNGIHASWTAPAYAETVTFSLYRSSAGEITSIGELTPVIEDIPHENTSVVDTRPSSSAHCYVVAAKDAAGNISEPSNDVYLNFDLLPVESLTVEQTAADPPVLSWTHAGDIAGCNIFLGEGENRLKLNEAPLSGNSYTDTGYTKDERTYTVVAVDANGHESLARTITLPPVALEPTPGTEAEGEIRRGLMNMLKYRVASHASTDIAEAKLRVTLNEKSHVSAPFSLKAGEDKSVPVTIGGYADLPDAADAEVMLTITEAPNETIHIRRFGSLNVKNGRLGLRLVPGEFTRGGAGTVRFTLENTGAGPIEIITARHCGEKPTDDIAISLEDKEGNILATKNLLAVTGEDLVTLPNGSTVARIAPDAFYSSPAIELPIPANAPDELHVRMDIAHIYYRHNQPDEVVMAGMSTAKPVSLIDTAYYGEISSAEPETSTGDTDITIRGRAVARKTGESLAAVPLTLVVRNDGFERTNTVYTDQEGSFSWEFSPLAGESGTYHACAVHPDLTGRPRQASFVISGVSLEYATYELSIPRNYEHTTRIRARAGKGTTVHNLRFECLPEDQPEGVIPEGLHIGGNDPVPALEPQQHTDVSFTAWADSTADEEIQCVLRLVSDEAPGGWTKLPLTFHFKEAAPALWFAPDHVETGTRMGEPVTEIVTLENRGTETLEAVSLELVHPDGTPAPDWVYTTAKNDLGDIEPDNTRDVAIVFSPPHTAAEDDYEFRLRVRSQNFETTDIHLYAAVTRSGQGHVLFKVSDLYTGTLDEADNPVQGLEGARILLQNEEVRSEEYTAATDELGEALFTGIPAGRYKYRVRADSHQQDIGRIWIKPEITATEKVFLEYNLVTVEWEVTETTIEDKYDIVLTATYETDVPAPVVVVEPTTIQLPDMAPGDVLTGEITMTNYGLVRADDLQFAALQDDKHYQYKMLDAIPDSLDAKERVTIPYRITCIAPVEGNGEDTGGGCGSYSRCGSVSWRYICANDKEGGSGTTYCVTRPMHCSGGGGPAHGAGGGGYIGGGGSGGGGGPAPTAMAGTQCLPENPWKPCFADPCTEKSTCKNVGQDTGSSVNTVTREYTRNKTDLSVKIPGGQLDYGRAYRAGGWSAGLTLNGRYMPRADKMVLEKGITGGAAWIDPLPDGEESEMPTSWILDGIYYKLVHGFIKVSTVCEPFEGCTTKRKEFIEHHYLFRNSAFRIIETNAGLKWMDARGNWKLYDKETGQALAIGNPSGTLAEYQYAGESERITGVTDRNGSQVLWYEYDDADRVVAVSDAAGRRTAYTYTDNGHLAAVTDVNGHETAYDYILLENDQGDIVKAQLTKVALPSGNTIHIGYNSAGDMVRHVKDDDGSGYSFAYDYEKGEESSYAMIRSTTGMVKEIWYDKHHDTKRVDINGTTVQTIEKIAPPGTNGDDASAGRILLETDENGHTTRKEYNEWAQLTREVHPDGSQRTIRYNPAIHKPSSKTDERGIVTDYAYDAQGNLIRKTEAAGTDAERITAYSYDADGNLTEISVAGTPDAVTSMTYDAAGNMTSITDPENGYVQFTEHDITGNVLSKTDANGNSWSYSYDAAGNMTAATDPLGNTTAYEYDAAGNKIKEIAPDGTETRYAYDLRGNMVKQTLVMDPGDETKDLVTTYAYTFDGKLLQSTDPEGVTTLYQYDARGRLVSTIDGAGNQTHMAYAAGSAGCADCTGSAENPTRIEYPTYTREIDYDKRGRKIAQREITVDLPETTFAYDPAGNLIEKTDKNGRHTYYAYDALGRLTTVTDPAAGQTFYTYDSRDNLASLTDAEGNVTRFTYDANNRLTKEIRPQGEETTYDYDPAGNLVEKVDAKGRKTGYSYDATGRLTHIDYYAAASDNTPVKSVSFSYDMSGNLTGYDDGTTSATYSYDAAGRKISESVNFGTFTKTMAYSHYKNGLKKSYTGPDGVRTGYLYNHNQLAGVRIPGLGFISINQYKWNRPESITLPGGTTREYAYDPLMRIRQITARDPGNNDVLNYQYDYDKMDNIIARVTGEGDYHYRYDALYRLTHTDTPEITELSNESFTYDQVGNRLTSADTPGTWSYNPNNELLGHAAVQYEYDANGNMTRKITGDAVTSYVYNTEDRLTEVWNGDPETGSLTAKYYYDPFGRRLFKEVNGIRTYYMYADEGLAAEMDASGRVTKTYGWKPGGTWGTDPLYMAEDTDGSAALEYYFYHNDHLGTPQKMTDPSGAVVWSATYSSFGEAHVDPASTVTNNLRFPGQYEDRETGLHYNWFRYYGPGSGRYLRIDPLLSLTNVRKDFYFIIPLLLEMPSKHLPYVYALNNPNRFIDPEGLDCGSGIYNIVPERPLPWCDFGDCCKKHDDCYAGKQGCEKTQEDCDDEFCSCVKDIPWTGCGSFANAYCETVRKKGKRYYDNARKNSCCNDDGAK